MVYRNLQARDHLKHLCFIYTYITKRPLTHVKKIWEVHFAKQVTVWLGEDDVESPCSSPKVGLFIEPKKTD